MNNATNEAARDAGAPARAAADRITRRLVVPTRTALRQQWRAQSLAGGAAGSALLHIARAHADIGSWDVAHTWLAEAARGDILGTDDAGLYLGAPAVAFALHTAAAGNSGRYTRAIATLDTAVTAVTHRRIDRAHSRISRGQRPTLAEYDLISGLTGIGAHLLQHRPGDDALGRVLAYLVRLSEPLRSGPDVLPGWWTGQDPHGTPSPHNQGGHANAGMAHGITGPLALLALARRRGIEVDGHLDAIEGICAWLDRWRIDHHTGPWWPQWITRADHDRGHVHQPGPLRPSWCYGTPGIARAQQLAAIATSDTARQRMAEHALTTCLSDPAQLNRITDSSLCHGWAGLFQTAWRAAADAATPDIAHRLPHLTGLLLRQVEHDPDTGNGLLEGDAGLALALHTTAGTDPTRSGWDTCLLIA